MKNKLPYCNIRFVFQTKCKISNFFTFKDKIPLFFRSGIVYKFQSRGCNATYYDKTKHHFKVRMCEHLESSALTGKRVKGDDDSAIKQHLSQCPPPLSAGGAGGLQKFSMLPKRGALALFQFLGGSGVFQGEPGDFLKVIFNC